MTIPDLIVALRLAEKRIEASAPIDNMKAEDIRLVLYPDGSGAIEARIRDFPIDEEPGTIAVAERRIMADYSEWRPFDTVDEFDAVIRGFL